MHSHFKKLALIGSFYLLLNQIAYAQWYQSDTLNQILVSGIKYQKYNIGSTSFSWKDTTAHQQSLGQKIAEKFPVHFINRGAKGQLSTINLRGVGGSRTNLIWNNLEINSFTLGESDYGLIPAMVADQVTLTLGNNTALWGNGSIGGSINLSSQPSFTTENQLASHLGIGSFGERQMRLSHTYAENNINLKTQVYYLQTDNNFQFPLADSMATQQNAAFQNFGALADFYFKPGSNQLLSINSWFNFSDRQIQPSKYDFNNQNKLTDYNLRMIIAYAIQKEKNLNEMRLGYTHDYQIFNQSQAIVTNRLYASYENDWQLLPNLSWKNGFNLNYLRPQVHAFPENPEEIRSDLYSSLAYKAQLFSLALNLRQPTVDGELKSFSPSLGIEVHAIEREEINFKLTAQAGRGFRLPTLNDRFWFPGGNPDLLPELSRNIEAGYQLSYKPGIIKYRTSANFFHNSVDNWIEWRPGGRTTDNNGETISFWYPDNIRLVHATGIEFFHHLELQDLVPSSKILVDFSGTYTRTTNKTKIDARDRSYNKQLRYTPQWMLNGGLGFSYHQFLFNINSQYTGKRYTENNNELRPLSDFLLINLSLGKSFKTGNIPVHLSANINNLFNARYENFQNMAMPGINYQLNLSFNYNL
jgi:vitamin B12 transporter